MLSKDQIEEALKSVTYPGFSRDIVSFGLIKAIEVNDQSVCLKLEITTGDQRIPGELDSRIRKVLLEQPGIASVEIDFKVHEPAQAASSKPAGSNRIEGIQHIIAVASGKGGVGKSTVSANLAVAAAREGMRVGLLDCDLYGPSMGVMFGVDERPAVTEEDRLEPHLRHGVRLMSMGFLVESDSPVILRGPMVTRYTQQFLQQVNWGHLDILFLDLPPGTGDIQLTIVQTVALSGALVVTTPQEVALIDARKAVSMFGKVNVPVLGLIENMSYFLCPHDSTPHYIFGESGGKQEAKRLNVPLLGQIPLEVGVRCGGDQGNPVVSSQPESSAAKEFANISHQLDGILKLRQNA